MTIEIRAITPDEFPDLLELDRLGFGIEARKPGFPDSWARAELDRTRVAFDGGGMVGSARNYTFEVTVPGGALLPAAAVSWISVLPTHRRRGVLTAMMHALHDDAREHDEPVAILTASESVIYSRFGYGIATWRLAIEAERERVHFIRPANDSGRVRFVDDAEAEKVFPIVYDAARRLRTGMVSRPDYWWPESVRWLCDEFDPTFRVVHEDADGAIDAYAWYSLRGSWEGGLTAKRLQVIDLVTTNSAARDALWRYLFGVDLVHTVSATHLPVDEPLRLMCTDPRRIRTDFLNDGMWLCVLDEEAALSARTYATEQRLSFEVHRPNGDVVTVEVEGGPDGARCRPAPGGADIALGTSQLSAAYLGGVTFREMHDARLVDEHTPGAIDRADALFATRPAPAMTSWF
jgi:predicted acetyltransferase